MSIPPPPVSPQPFPPQLNYAPPPARNDLHTIAVRQRAILFCILGYLMLVVLQASKPPQPFPIIIGFAALGVALTGAVFTFMLSLALYTTAAGIVLGILALIPLIGLIPLLVVNSKATRTLRNHGIQVGLLGARRSQIPSLGQTP